jgi:undecaprenyl-diphosphatase
MSLIESILLGILQGLTEFIPVSSTAHLLIAQRLLHVDPNDPGVFAFNVLVQLGTLVSLILFAWSDLVAIGRAWVLGVIRRQPFADPQARLGWYMILASIPALVAGIIFKPLVEALFRTQMLEAFIRLTLSVFLLALAERIGHRTRTLDSFTWKDALWVGCAQILAVFPGSSRSGSTIAGGMTRHFDRPSAARFAFLLAVPMMVAAGAYETLGLVKDHALAAAWLPQIAVGFIAAAIVGYLAIRWLMAYLARRPLYDFAIYCTALAMVTLVLMQVLK